MVINNVFEIGEIVYLKTDKDQLERMVTGIMITPAGVQYRIGCASADSWQYEIECSKEKNVVYATSS